jgi:hypothetical protein
MRPEVRARPMAALLLIVGAGMLASAQIGREVAVPHHLADGQEFSISRGALLEHGRLLFAANWTRQEGAGRPLVKGTGGALADRTDPLVFPRNFNRFSAPDANSCAGCHNMPFGIAGGGGDIVANVFVMAQRFDFATMNLAPDGFRMKGTSDERGRPISVESLGNSRNTLGMFGSGYVEMLARQMTADLQKIRDTIGPGQSAALGAKGVSFGVLARDASGRWIADGVQGLPLPSLVEDPPSLLIRPFHQAGNVVSLRQFTNNAFVQHHGIQTTERFGRDVDADGDGIVNEMTAADVTAVTIYQAAMAVPGRVIPTDPHVERAIAAGERRFVQIGCATCHVPKLPLIREGWIFTEPNPYNPPGNRRLKDGPVYSLDLTSADLPLPRLQPENGIVWVPAFTDLKLHDITDGPDDPNRESVDMNAPPGSAAFFQGNARFLTRKLWGTANEPPFFHHGMYTTLREAVLAHGGEASRSRAAFKALAEDDRDALIEFLKSLQVLPPGTRALVVDERGRSRSTPLALDSSRP